MKATATLKLKLKIRIFLPDGTYAGEIETGPGEIDGKVADFLVKYLQRQEKKSGAVLDAAELLGVDERTIWRRLRKFFL